MEIKKISRLIHLIRGHRVMLDEDLARLYGVPVKVLNQQVMRNRSRFPEDFMFRLTQQESAALRSQFVTLEKVGRGHYRKYWPLAFTREGIGMLSSVLRSPRGVGALIGLEHEQSEQAAAIHELFAEFRRLASGDG